MSVKLELLFCPFCDFKSEYKGTLKAHIVDVHLNTKQFQCDLCPFNTEDENCYNEHVNEHTCNVSDFESPDKGEIKNHKKLHFNCRYEGTLKTHVFHCHLNTNEFQCDLCPFNTDDENCYNEHTCNVYDFELLEKSGIKNHKKLHLNTKKFNCSMCNYATSDKLLLDGHIENHIKDEECIKMNSIDDKKLLSSYVNIKAISYLDIIQAEGNFCIKPEINNIHTVFNNKEDINIRDNLQLTDDISIKGKKSPKSTIKKSSKQRKVKFGTDTKVFKNYSTKCLTGERERKKERKETKNSVKDKKIECHICDFGTNRMGNLTNHIRKSHPKIGQFGCYKCKKIFSSNSKLNQHKSLVHEEAERKCDICNFESSSKGNLKRHKDRVHLNLTKFECDMCLKAFLFESELKKHVLSAHEGLGRHRNKECGQCNYVSKNNSDMKRHVDGVHLMIPLLRCASCSYIPLNKRILKLHFDSVHRKIKPFPCKFCDFGALTEKALGYHIDGKHLKIKPLSCEDCDYRCVLPHDLKNHVNEVHLNKPREQFPCEYEECEFVCYSGGRLKVHVETVHLRKTRFSCDKCTYKTYNRCKLKQHVKMVHEICKVAQCEKCGYISSSKRDMQLHIYSVHDNGVILHCSLCNYQVAYMNDLNRHIDIVHNKLKPHSCTMCDMKFPTTAARKTHIDGFHYKMRRFYCTNGSCTFGSYTSADLDKHTDAVHLKIRNVSCPKCDFITARKSSLYKHLRKMHVIRDSYAKLLDN